MDIRLVILLLALVPIVGAGLMFAFGANTLWVVVLGGVMIYLAYNLYSKRVDREIIQADAKKATPAKMYMDGVDFMPTSRTVLYGYHFKSVAAAGPIVGVITAANLWGWFPSILWLILGVTFIGWVADYSAIMLSVRNDGNSLSAIAYRLIAPRTRTILFVFIFFYLILVAGAFMGIMTALMAARPDVPLGIFALAVMGLLAGQMLYRWKMDLILVTVITVGVTLGAMMLGPFGNAVVNGKSVDGPVVAATKSLNQTIDGLTGNTAIMEVVDPTYADPRIPALVSGKRASNALFDAATGAIKTMPSYLFWALFILIFSYLGSNLPIWRFAQPVNYIGFWITILAIGFTAIGGIVAPFVAPKVALFQTVWFKGFMPTQAAVAGNLAPIQPLWPMLFVTIACGAISGWHSLIGSVNTSRQLEYETDALPVGGGGMLSENALALLSLTAVSIAGGAGAGAFASGIGKLLSVLFGSGFETYGTALGFGTFMVIVLTVTQLLFRVMRVTLTEWLGDALPVLRNIHVSTVVSMVLTVLLVLSGTWVYLWQLFGASNQLLAALGLLLVTVWLRSVGKNPTYAAIPMVFMYVTTMASMIVTAYNLYVSVLTAPSFSGQFIVQLGGWAMILVSLLLFVAAAIIAWDSWAAWKKYSGAPKTAPAPAE
ncbi:MAG: carbon starvation protein A [Chloroflexi bacterium]|nr:carbon starvation protein A [Chloroflexota bacterium]